MKATRTKVSYAPCVFLLIILSPTLLQLAHSQCNANCASGSCYVSGSTYSCGNCAGTTYTLNGDTFVCATATITDCRLSDGTNCLVCNSGQTIVTTQTPDDCSGALTAANAIEGCASQAISSPYTCLKAKPGYNAPSSTQTTALTCSVSGGTASADGLTCGSVPNCYTYRPDTSTSATSVYDQAHCLLCDNTGATTYYLSGDATVCGSTQYCQAYTNGVCSSCISGKILGTTTSGTSTTVACVVGGLPGCSSYDASNLCLSCYSGTLTSGACTGASLISDCKTSNADDVTKCDTCRDGFTLTTSQTSCSSNCKTGTNADGTCTDDQCSTGTYDTTQKLCIVSSSALVMGSATVLLLLIAVLQIFGF